MVNFGRGLQLKSSAYLIFVDSQKLDQVRLPASVNWRETLRKKWFDLIQKTEDTWDEKIRNRKKTMAAAMFCLEYRRSIVISITR